MISSYKNPIRFHEISQIIAVSLSQTINNTTSRQFMNMLQDLSLLEENARVIVESAKGDEYPADAGRLHRYKEAVYGITKISYYVYSEEE